MRNLPSVVIVGRMNVGKSTLFNRLAVKEKTLIFDYPGVTRDFVTDVVQWKNRSFILTDTGGIDIKKAADPLQEEVRQRALGRMQEADLILFVCDGTTGPLIQDQEIAQSMRKLNKKVLLVINKIDSPEQIGNEYQFKSLGFPDILSISAEHGKGIHELLDAILARIPLKGSTQEHDIKASIVLLGKPNVGKSSLMNALLEQERMIISEIPGTTREAVSEQLRFYQETLLLTDTPGVRKKRAIEEPLEQLMVKSSLRAVKKADIVLLMVDGSAGELSDQELKLAFYAFEQGKGLILLINKSDLVTEQLQESFENQAPLYRQLLNKIPRLFISCRTKKNIGKILPLVQEVYKNYTQQLDNTQLTLLFKEWLSKTPLFHATHILRVYEVQQVSTRPITLVLYVNNPEWFGPSQCAFFENKMRLVFNVLGVPIQFIVRKSKRTE